MLSILILFLYFEIWFIISSRFPEKEIRRTFLESGLLIFAFIAIATELLSLFNSLTSITVTLLWITANLALIGWFYKDLQKGGARIRREFQTKIKSAPKFYLVLSIFIYLVILIIASASPPNTYDSMTYHLARVANWIQNGSVGFYPTAILRQLYQPPLAEYSILHLQLLSGNDYCANFVQWFSLVSCGIAASLIVKVFGQNTKIQWFTIVLTITLPAAIVQGSSTQNDLIVSLFILIFFYFWLIAIKSSSWVDFVWTGLALGLALLTKGTAYVFCFPIGLFFVAAHFFTLKKSPARWRFSKQVVLVLFIAIVFNFGQYARNYNLFGAPISTGEEKMSNQNLTTKMIFSNLTRNYAIHLGTNSTLLKTSLEDLMTTTFGDELKNPDSTWLDNQFSITFSTHEDSAGNFIHILLITLALLLVFFVRGNEKKYIYCISFSIVFGFALFSILLKWQIWASRLQMPLFMLGIILVAIVIARLLPRIAIFVAILCFLAAYPFIFSSAPRRIFTTTGEFVLNEPRHQKYFKNLPDLEPIFNEATDFIKQQPNAPESVGLYIGYNDYEYPLWLLLKKDFSQKPYLYHVGITNVSSKLVGDRPMPDFIISMRDETTIENIEYTQVWSNNIVKVLQKNDLIIPQ